MLVGPNVISNLIKPFSDKNVGLVGGNPQPLPGKTIVERGVNCSVRVFDKLRVLGHWAYGCHGRILAVSKNLARKVNIPRDMIANDVFMYFFAFVVDLINYKDIICV